jgi:serine/threonine protein kinase
MIGTKLGPYEITAKLGEGGMGAVYRARDAKLEREVAIKVLPTALGPSGPRTNGGSSSRRTAERRRSP